MSQADPANIDLRSGFYSTLIPEAARGQRLDDFLAAALGLSKSTVRKWIVIGLVRVNERVVRSATFSLRSGVRLSVKWNPREVENLAVTPPSLEPSKSPPRLKASDLLFEDEWLVVVQKPTGLPTQPTLDPKRLNLWTSMKSFLQVRDESTEEPYLGLHHRLDVGVSGAILFTKKKEANKSIADQFKEHLIQKTYLALTTKKGGKFELPELFTVENRLDKVGNLNGKAKMGSVLKGGLFAKTDFRVISRVPAERFFLIECKPITGRTHQIRVHLAEKNLPILGDRLYGGPEDFKYDRIYLHAHVLEFTHPITGKPMRVESILPTAFRDQMEGRHVVR